MSDCASMVAAVPAGVLVICRVGGMMCCGPMFGLAAVPAHIRLMLSIGLGGAVCALLASRGEGLAGEGLSMWELAPLAALEALIGVFIGFVASLPLLAAQSAGVLMSQQMGLGFGQLVNPTLDDQGDVVGQFLHWSALAGFLVVGGHEWTFLAVLKSFDHLPAAHVAFDGGLVAMMVGALGAAMELTLRVAAPLVSLMCLESVAMGALARSVPQLNVLAMGFPMRIAAGVGLLAAAICVMQENIVEAMRESMSGLLAWMESGASACAGATNG
ncbi:MAG: flagellar biosynthetic protein FliR [Phycisphaerales bacterium]|nr:flagellar biosynthetic protein FliR [Phycisphaerales bacterium]